jgi:hypothetical protein
MADDLIDRLRLEAQIHAQEARTANATIAEIYQLCSGGKGEPGNWNGAEPVRALVAERDALAATLRQQAARVDEVEAKARELYEAYRTEHPDARMYSWEQQPFEPTREHWREKARAALEAALSAQPAEPVLDADARIGHMVFRKGVRWSTVIGAAQRQFKYHEAQPAPGASGTGPLSERLRAGIECAPWVLAAVQKLEAQIAAQTAERQGEGQHWFDAAYRNGTASATATTHPAAPVGVPDEITDLDECRKVGWHDSAPAYRAGWNACRTQMLALAAAPSAPQGVDRG